MRGRGVNDARRGHTGNGVNGRRPKWALSIHTVAETTLPSNEKKGSGVNVVYRREDGNIGWIDPG